MREDPAGVKSGNRLKNLTDALDHLRLAMAALDRVDESLVEGARLQHVIDGVGDLIAVEGFKP